MVTMTKNEKIVVFTYSRNGLQTALRTAACFPNTELQIFAPKRVLSASGDETVQAIPEDNARFYEECFARADLLIFVSALGIAVRKIAPFVKDKSTDPAVVCLDEKGTYVISVLSGHIGGANVFAGRIAQALGAVPVITTATDVNHRFSVDAWAAANDMIIDDLKTAKAVSAAILEGDVPMESDLAVASPYPAGVVPSFQSGDSVAESGICRTLAADPGSDPIFVPGILISWEKRQPFTPTLRLIPKVLHLGIGCRKGTSEEQIRAVVDKVLDDYHIDRRAVRGVYSIDLKAEEAGLLAYCKKNHWPLTVYTSAELQAVQGDFTASEFVQSITGVDNVCERAALREADRLLVPKTAKDGVTVAVAAELPELYF